MIINFRHEALQQYYGEGNGAKLPAQYLRKINRVLDQLDAVSSVSDIQQMGSGIHKLTGDMADFWSIAVTPNYRIFSALRAETFTTWITSIIIKGGPTYEAQFSPRTSWRDPAGRIY